MAEPPALWAFVLANALVFVFGSVLAGLSYVAYRQSGGRASFRIAAAGFGVVVLGGLVEPVYQLGVRGDFLLDGTELMVLQTAEGVLIALGLGLLFYAIARHGAGESADADDRAAGDDDAAVPADDRFWSDY